MKEQIFKARRIFDGDHFIENPWIHVQNGRIKSIGTQESKPEGIPVSLLKADLVVPAYKDLQINGAGGLMFSADPTVEALQEIYTYSKAGGATGFMATIPTNHLSLIRKAVDAIKSYWKKGLPGLLGLHLEGPYINPVKKGAHLKKFITTPTLQSVRALLKMGEGTIKMITLAPECCPDDVLKYLVNEGVILSAGHSNATYQEAKKGFSLGIKMCTHLFNAMSPFSHKDAGLVGAAFDSTVYAGIIMDGVHVNATALKAAHQLMPNRLCYVTDAVTAVDSETYYYKLAKDRYITREGTLAGSCLKMNKAVQNAMSIGITPEVALQNASLLPAKVLQQEQRFGKIAPGYAVDWALLDDHFDVLNTLSL